MEKHRLISFILVSCILLISCGESVCSKGQEFSVSKTELLSNIKPLAELITSEQPSLKETVRLLQGHVKEYEKERIVSLKASGYSALLFVDRMGENATVSDIEIRTKLDMEIEFHRDIVPLLGGEWVEIAKKSKYPAARFIYSNRQTGKRAIVFINLYYPPQKQPSPVQGIIIRIERPTKNK